VVVDPKHLEGLSGFEPSHAGELNTCRPAVPGSATATRAYEAIVGGASDASHYPRSAERYAEKLTAVRDQLDRLLDEAGLQELSLRETWCCLCERRDRRKDERRIEMTLKLARFLVVGDLPGFDFSAQPSR
jgi:hypothetical protein